MTDYVDGAESDSGYTIEVTCSQCHQIHTPSISKIGRFMYKCGKSVFNGTVDNWRQVVKDAQAARERGPS